MLKGAIHVHSTYSDGEFTLQEIKDLFLAEGCSFVCMTDHAEAFEKEGKLLAYVQELESLSDATFLFVPGLEYECEQRMHILGYGTTAPSGTTDPQAVIRHIEAQGAVSVIAHPKDSMFPWIESFGTLPQGIEAWNSKYDGQYAPRVETFRLVQRMQTRRPDLRSFYGQDLHWRKQYRGLFVFLNTEELGRRAILNDLATGNFIARKDDLELSSDGVLSDELCRRFSDAHKNSLRLRAFLKTGKQTLDRMGIRVPAGLKAQIRRIF
jgi:hypothetical protein